MFKATHAAKRRGWLRPLPKQIAGMPEAQAPFKIQEPIQIKLQFATNNKLDTSPDISSDNGVTQPQTEDVDTYHTRCHRQHRQHTTTLPHVTQAHHTKCNTDRRHCKSNLKHCVLGPLNPTSSPRKNTETVTLGVGACGPQHRRGGGRPPPEAGH